MGPAVREEPQEVQGLHETTQAQMTDSSSWGGQMQGRQKRQDSDQRTPAEADREVKGGGLPRASTGL